MPPRGYQRAMVRDWRGIAEVRKFVSAFAAISLLAAPCVCTKSGKASNRSGGDQQIEQSGAAKVGEAPGLGRRLTALIIFLAFVS